MLLSASSVLPVQSLRAQKFYEVLSGILEWPNVFMHQVIEYYRYYCCARGEYVKFVKHY